jgi:NADH dehydrogenase
VILIAGGSGRLGRSIVGRLVDRDLSVRVLSRHPDSAAGPNVELVSADVRDPVALAHALGGVRTIVSAITGFGPGGAGPAAVDHLGNRNLIRAAREAGVGHFVLVSIHNAGVAHPMELYRAKERAERELRASGLEWSIFRPTVSMETWAEVVGAPIRDKGRARIFGRGDNPVNFVSAGDVADVIVDAVVDGEQRGATLDVGGPENLTLRQVVCLLQEAIGRTGPVGHVPLLALRAAAAVLGVVKPDLARLVEAAVEMDTADMSLAPAPGRTSFAEVARRELA